MKTLFRVLNKETEKHVPFPCFGSKMRERDKIKNHTRQGLKPVLVINMYYMGNSIAHPHDAYASFACLHLWCNASSMCSLFYGLWKWFCKYRILKVPCNFCFLILNILDLKS